MNSRFNINAVLIAILAFVAGFFAANIFHYGWEGSMMPYQQYSFPKKAEYSSNGEMIFMTGVNERGERIPFAAGPQWLYMHGGGCASCHGTDGRGGVYPMMCGVKTPDIRYSILSEKHGMSDEDIIRAITKGVDDEGNQLDLCMPRWQMSEKDIRDVIDYLKELG